MDMMIFVLIFCASLFIIVLLGIVMVISGKDIFFAFKRVFSKNGSDVFIANTNRVITHFFKVPKDDAFIINGQKYITNPDKCMNLNEIDKIRVYESMNKKAIRLQARISEIDAKIELLQGFINTTKDDSEKIVYQSELIRHQSIKETYEAKLKERINNYFNRRRQCYFYLEGDAIPKDFYEYYSQIDNQILDNMLVRAISRPVDLSQEQLVKTLNFVKLGIVVCAVLLLISVALNFLNYRSIDLICAKVGANCKLKG
jgi:hypothetical protein